MGLCLCTGERGKISPTLSSRTRFGGPTPRVLVSSSGHSTPGVTTSSPAQPAPLPLPALGGGRDQQRPRRVLKFPSQLLPACPQGKEAESPRDNQRANPTHLSRLLDTDRPALQISVPPLGDDHWQDDDSHLRRRVCMRGGELHARKVHFQASKQSGRQAGLLTGRTVEQTCQNLHPPAEPVRYQLPFPAMATPDWGDGEAAMSLPRRGNRKHGRALGSSLFVNTDTHTSSRAPTNRDSASRLFVPRVSRRVMCGVFWSPSGCALPCLLPALADARTSRAGLPVFRFAACNVW